MENTEVFTALLINVPVWGAATSFRGGGGAWAPKPKPSYVPAAALHRSLLYQATLGGVVKFGLHCYAIPIPSNNAIPPRYILLYTHTGLFWLLSLGRDALYWGAAMSMTVNYMFYMLRSNYYITLPHSIGLGCGSRYADHFCKCLTYWRPINDWNCTFFDEKHRRLCPTWYAASVCPLVTLITSDHVLILTHRLIAHRTTTSHD